VHLKFLETTNSGNWVVVKNPISNSKRSHAQVILDDLAEHHQLEFVGRRHMRRNEEVIWICGLNDEHSPRGDLSQEAEPDGNAIQRFIDYGTRYLHSALGTKPVTLEVIEKGRTYRPTNSRGLPIIAPIPTAMLKSSYSDSSSQRSHLHSGIWISTGHGKYGMTLGMGSGKLISQMILGGKPDREMTKFGLPK
jgi:glycine/D-amino acid oxidase-like deaminating enzyme